MPTFIPTILLWRCSANRACAASAQPIDFRTPPVLKRHPRKAAPVKRGAIALVLD